MTWFYTQMVQWHVLLAWCSVALFFTRHTLDGVSPVERDRDG